MRFYNWRVENKTDVASLWIGPFVVFLVVNNPEYIKHLLKS